MNIDQRCYNYQPAQSQLNKLRSDRRELLETLRAVFAEFLYYRPQGGEYPMLGGKRADTVEAQVRATIAKVEQSQDWCLRACKKP